MPFHVVRTRVLGNIASPDMTASPMDTLAGLCGGELPAIDNLDALNELLRVLLMGLWNRLARHQNRNAPFRMIRIDAPETREGLANIAAIRREEVIGFIEGMFGKEQGLVLPERARRALEALAEAGGLLRGVSEVARDPTKPASADDIAQTRHHISELTQICEREIHSSAVVLHTGASPTAKLRVEYETNPTLTAYRPWDGTDADGELNGGSGGPGRPRHLPQLRQRLSACCGSKPVASAISSPSSATPQ
jgi:hypothetical protein